MSNKKISVFIEKYTFGILKKLLTKKLKKFLTDHKKIVIDENSLSRFIETIDNLKTFFKIYRKFSGQKHLDYFCIHLTGECNLKCIGCDHFAPLAKGEYLAPETFEKDFKRLSELTSGKIKRIGLLGGEPLLHRRLTDFFIIARKYFPKSKIQIITNGILLLNQNDIFWKECKKNSIEIIVTKYPLNLNYDEIKKQARLNKVKFSFYGDTGKNIKKSYKCTLDLTGSQNQLYNATHCFHFNRLCFLSEGKLYTCTVAPNIYRFNEKFNKNLPLSEKDYIDIYKAKDEKEILNFLSNPIPFCKYCDIKNRIYEIQWSRSKQNITEWI